MRKHVRPRSDGKDWRFAEMVFEGSIVATRLEDGIRIRAGDVEVNATDDGVEVQLKKK